MLADVVCGRWLNIDHRFNSAGQHATSFGKSDGRFALAAGNQSRRQSNTLPLPAESGHLDASWEENEILTDGSHCH